MFCRWLVNGSEVPLGLDLRYSLVAGSLVISSPELAPDAGSYQCLASNRCGTILSRAATLKFGCEWDDVLPRPSVPPAVFSSCSPFPLQICTTSPLTAGVPRPRTKEQEPSWPADPPPTTQVPPPLYACGPRPAFDPAPPLQRCPTAGSSTSSPTS